MSHGGANPKKAVQAALAANAGIALAKFVAAALSGSATMWAEGVHSLADTSNQGLLLLGMTLAARRASPQHPLGHHGESYFWAFIVSLLLFFLGGVFALYEGAHRLLEGSRHPGSLLSPLIVLGISAALEGSSFFVAAREFNKSRAGRPLGEALFGGKDPVIPLVLLEDTGALIGLLMALCAICASAATGSNLPDAIGSMLIGLLLCSIGLLLARDTRSLLVGEGIDAATRKRLVEIAREDPDVHAVTQLLSLHLGPDAVLVALKVRFRADMQLPDLERSINALEARVREALPAMKRIFVEPDSEYDPARDPEFVS